MAGIMERYAEDKGYVLTTIGGARNRVMSYFFATEAEAKAKLSQLEWAPGGLRDDYYVRQWSYAQYCKARNAPAPMARPTEPAPVARTSARI